MKKEFILNGTKITTLNKFYDEVEKELLVDTTAIGNWSLDVLDDVFLGGYGVYDLKGEIVIRWTNFRRSKGKMKRKTLESIINILQSKENIELIFE